MEKPLAMMDRICIQNAENPCFSRVWEIYRYSFPVYQQRTPEHQLTAFKSNLYHMEAFVEGGEVIGLIGYWVFPDYTYIEHYAMASPFRGQGRGTEILKEFLERQENKTVVLEIDPVVDGISARRLRFYQNLGFRESPFRHQCPSYQSDAEEGELWVLTHPETVDCDFYEVFYHDLHQVVMAR